MSLVVLDIELTDKNVIKELGVFIDGSVQGFSFLFAIFCDIKVMNAEVFAKGLEKCSLLSNLHGRNVEKLDNYGCPKIQDLVKGDSSRICSNYPFRHKTRLHCAEKKAKVYGEWAMQHL